MANGTMKGSGTALDPYIIEDIADFKAVGNTTLTLNYELVADLDFEGETFSASVIGLFSLNGNNHKIKNLHVEGTGSDANGIIKTPNGGFVRNLYFENCSIKNTTSVASLITNGSLTSVHAINCNVNGGGSNSGGGTGGIGSSPSSLDFCSFVGGTVKGANVAGGLAGSCSKVSNCFFNGEVGGVGFRNSGNFGCGGIIGAPRSNTTITNCYVAGWVGSDDIGMPNLGGMIGTQYQSGAYNITFNNCFTLCDFYTLDPNLEIVDTQYNGIGTFIGGFRHATALRTFNNCHYKDNIKIYLR